MNVPIAGGGKLDVVVADDDVLVILALRQMLGPMASLRAARNGAECLRLCTEAPPDALILDVHMPGMGGLEVARALRAQPHLDRTALLLITADESEHVALRAAELGANGHLAKPLNEDVVRARVLAAVRDQVLRRGNPAPLPRERPVALIVDDDVNSVRELQLVLGAMHLECVCATQGAQAVSLARATQPDLVLLDVQMPEVDGFAVARALQADPLLADIPVVFVTRFSDPATESRALEEGRATDFITKPCSEPVLRARLRNLLRLRLQARDELQREREHWQRVGVQQVAEVVARSSDAILGVTVRGVAVMFNASASRLFGREAEAVLGQPVLSWLPAPMAAVLQRALDAGRLEDAAGAPAHGALAPTPVRWQPADGPLRELELTAQSQGLGERRLVTLTLRDHTDRVAATREAAERALALSQSEAKSRLIGYLAHELGNPLQGVVGLSQLLLQDAVQPLHPGQRRRLQGIIDCARQMAAVLRDTQDLTQQELGAFQVQARPVAAWDALHDALHLVEAQAELQGVALVATAGDAAVRVMADPVRLNQCLLNLLSNAVKYNRAGGAVRVAVVRDDQAGAQRVGLRIADEGAGLTPEQLGQLFEPFNRLGQQSVPGQGLGLVVTRMLARAMGGDLAVQSEVGQGSCFTLWLPEALTHPESQDA